MSPALPEGALRYACQRVQTFALIHATRGEDEQGDAMDLWLGHLGVTDTDRAKFRAWIADFVGDWCDGALFGLVLLGLVVGLWMNEYTSV